MTRRFRIALIFSLIVGSACAMIPRYLGAQKADRAKVLGEKLMCVCGCGQILTECNHLNCPSSTPMLKELNQHMSGAESDDLILQDFVQKYGEKVLSSPSSTGFNALAWYIPIVAFVLGLGIVAMVIRIWRQRDLARLATTPGAIMSPSHTDLPRDLPTGASKARETDLERARRQADRDTDN